MEIPQTKIEKLKELNAKRTREHWKLDYKTPFGVSTANYSTESIQSEPGYIEIVRQPFMTERNKDEAWANGRFITALANNATWLIEVAEAADEMATLMVGFSEAHEDCDCTEKCRFVKTVRKAMEGK